MGQTTADQIYQLKIVLKYMKPPVWRRVLVTGETMIGTLHEIVQIVMGWQNRHLYTFTVRGRDYGIAHEGGLSFGGSGELTFTGEAHADQHRRLSEFVLQPGERFRYVYDLGDNWEHEIYVEKIISPQADKTYPLCVAGRGDCPPEDSGGPVGPYAMRRRHHGTGKTESFAPEKANQELRILLKS